MVKYLILLTVLISPFASSDLTVVIVNPSSLPYDLRPSNYDNKASNYNNKESNYDNKASNYGNKASNYDNRRSNYANGPQGSRRLLTEDDLYMGYYVTRSDGHINYFYANGTRFGFTPKGGHTDSVFSDGSWCGTRGEIDGISVLGLEQRCYEKLTNVIQEEQAVQKQGCTHIYESYKRKIIIDGALRRSKLADLQDMNLSADEKQKLKEMERDLEQNLLDLRNAAQNLLNVGDCAQFNLVLPFPNVD
jgi:hypothetical protein